VSESRPALYSQDIKKTLLREQKDRGSWGVQGLTMPRRCTTKKAKETADRCSFYFNIVTESNENGTQWVIGPGGNIEHCGHAKLTAAEASHSAIFIPQEEIEVSNSVMAANAGSGAARDILFAHTGDVIQPAGLCYQQQKAALAASEFSMAMKGTPAEVFLDDLMSDDVVSYVALFDDMVSSDVLKETGKGRPKHRIMSRSVAADGLMHESEFVPPEHNEIKEECSTMRQSL
jgi:hypothetical protein